MNTKNRKNKLNKPSTKRGKVTQTYLLNYLRAIGLIKIPIICLAHHPLRHGRLTILRKPFLNLMIKGADAFPSLSSKVASEINTINNGLRKSMVLSWGPDANFYPTTCNVGNGVVAAGRTGRDFDTFGIAASQTGIHAHIICPPNSITPVFREFKKNIQITTGDREEHMKYPDLLEIYAKARVLAIPLVEATSLLGLTSLMDVLGMGKPVIITRNSFIDLDVEAEGIGRWVEPGDINGWKEAIQWFEDNEEQSYEMGKRARALVDNGMNSLMFAEKMMNIFEDIFKQP